MKKILFICLSFCMILSKANAQIRDTTSTVNNHKVDADLLLLKSKKQKTAAWILLGGGGTLILTGIIIPKGEITREAFFLRNDYKNDGIKSTLIPSGAVAMLGSIPFFIASKKNKKKAMSISFKNETVPQFYKQSIVSLPLSSLTLKLNL